MLKPKRTKIGRPSRMTPEVKKAGGKGYKLRQQGKAWSEIARITGVLTVYPSKNLLIEFQTRAYAKRHKLPWPPLQQQGEQNQ